MDSKAPITRQRTPQAHLRIAFLCGACAGLLALLIVWRQQAIWRTDGLPRTVVIAQKNLPARTRLTADLLTTRDMPQQYVPPQAASRVEAVLGLITTAPVLADEVIVASRIASPQQSGQLAAMIPAGRRAVAIPVDPVRGVGGMLQPGDHVDLFANFDFGAQEAVQGTTVLIQQDLEILSVGTHLGTTADPAAPPTKDAAPRSAAPFVTVSATVLEAQRILFALDNGSLSLVLRPAHGDEPAVQVAPATAAGVTGLTSLMKRKEYHGR